MQFELDGKLWALHLWQGPIRQRRRERIVSLARLHPGECLLNDFSGVCETDCISGRTVHNPVDKFKPITGKRIALTRALQAIVPPLTVSQRVAVWNAFMDMQPRPAVKITTGQARRLFEAAQKVLDNPFLPIDDGIDALRSVTNDIASRQWRR